MSTEQIDFISHCGAQPELFASFFWSEQEGLSCTNTDLMAEMERNGIALPPAGVKVFPRDGRAFFDGLKFRGGSYLDITAPRAVAH